jgi:aminopeptidase N
MAETVALDLRNSFRFFNEVYGPTTVEDFVATEIPFDHGEAYPGLVMLAWNTFQSTTSQGFDEMFRAHEVAHQWWGISVRPATYRDWWLAEGFSEFSGWWYAARARGSIDLYHRRLKETREKILARRDRSAPIGLGQRVGTSEEPADYQLTVYHKGAWVLHMLRTLLTDTDTGSDDTFTQVMRTFYMTHLGGMASTRTFQQTIEELIGADMGWYFDQWVYGSSIPTYTFSHTFEDDPSGNVKAKVRVRQENVPDDFRMIVPILLDFGDDGTAVVRVNVTGPLTETELPLLPQRPRDIVFNPFEAVLAETKTEGWR